MSDGRPAAGGMTTGGAGAMFFSAAIFGFFGFLFLNLQYHSVSTGEFLLFVALLDWTLKASAIVFLLAGLITLAHPRLGNVIYAVASLLGAVLFLVIAGLDLADTRHTVFAYAPLLLLVFGVWNGLTAWGSLRSLTASGRL